MEAYSETERARELGSAFHLRLLPLGLLFGAVPPFVASRLRTFALRASGFRIGNASVFWGLPTFVGSGAIQSRLLVGDHCGFNEGCFFDLDDSITIGNHVAVGHDVMFLTRSFEAGSAAQRAGALLRAPIVVEDGVWLGARCTLMPGVRVGAGSVIGASVVVSQDVAPNTLVIGTQKVSLAKWR